ncbi:MAG TPA: alpha-glucosidase C-terminal domain-containing protein, partial [Anaerolineales bacterium]|nr:alpha-glucosidase C-terminal domain-containing protein [Anaerolineales bacterium]
HEAVLAIRRGGGNGRKPVLCLHNVSHREQIIHLNRHSDQLKDLIGGQVFSEREKQLALTMRPYQVLWLSTTA